MWRMTKTKISKTPSKARNTKRFIIQLSATSGRERFMSADNGYNNFEVELKRIKAYLLTHNASASMVATALNIYRPNLCRHKRTLESIGALKVTHKGFCKITGRKVQYLSCDPEKVKGAINEQE